MKKLINYEFFKIRKKKIFLIILLLVLSASIYCTIESQQRAEYYTNEDEISLYTHYKQGTMVNLIYGPSAGNFGINAIIILSLAVLTSVVVGEEFGKGTVKLLYIRPYSRTKQYFAKFIAIFKTSLILLLVYLVGSYITSTVILQTDTASLIDMAKTMTISTVLIIPNILIIEALFFFIAYYVEKTPIAIVINFIISFFCSVGIPADYLWWPYTFMRYWSFQRFILGNMFNDTHNLILKSIIICIIYFVLFIYLGLRIARKKDIKNEA